MKTGKAIEGALVEVLKQFLQTDLAEFEGQFKDARVYWDFADRAVIEGNVSGQPHPLIRVGLEHNDGDNDDPEDAPYLSVPSIVLPPFMQHSGLGRRLLKKLFDLTLIHGYALIVTDLVPSFYRRLVARGARILVVDDVVQITHETDLLRPSKPGDSEASDGPTDIVEYLRSLQNT